MTPRKQNLPFPPPRGQGRFKWLDLQNNQLTAEAPIPVRQRQVGR